MDLLRRGYESVLEAVTGEAANTNSTAAVAQTKQLPGRLMSNKEEPVSTNNASRRVTDATSHRLGGLKRSRESSNSAARPQYAVKSASWAASDRSPAASRPTTVRTSVSMAQLRAAVAAGSRRALCSLGKRTFTGRGTPANPQAAETLFKLGATQGHVPCMFYLASIWMLQSAPGSLPFARGLRLMAVAADLGHPRAAHHAALMGAAPRRGEQCPIAAAKQLHVAVAGGYPPSASALGALYEAGAGVTACAATARQLHEAAVKHGVRDAVGALAASLDMEESAPADRQRALSLFHRGAVGGDLDCAYSLGVMYATGSAGGGVNLTKALRWLLPAAKAGDAAARNAAGNILGDPESPLRDDAAAVKWYALAAEQGHAEAQNNLAWMYERGHGCSVDIAAAVRWYTASARAGHPDAVYNLASMYIEGETVEPNDEMAVKLLLPLAQDGDHTAEYLLGGRLAEAPPPVRDEAAAVRWYMAAAAGGHGGAACALGVMHQLGRGTPASLGAAVRWYKLARELGDEDAGHNLAQLRQRQRTVLTAEATHGEGEDEKI